MEPTDQTNLTISAHAEQAILGPSDLVKALSVRIPHNEYNLPVGFYRVDYLPQDGTIDYSKNPDQDPQLQAVLRNAYVPLDYSEGYPTIGGQPFWSRLDFETPEAFHAFELYLRQNELVLDAQTSVLAKAGGGVATPPQTASPSSQGAAQSARSTSRPSSILDELSPDELAELEDLEDLEDVPASESPSEPGSELARNADCSESSAHQLAPPSDAAQLPEMAPFSQDGSNLIAGGARQLALLPQLMQTYNGGAPSGGLATLTEFFHIYHWQTRTRAYDLFKTAALKRQEELRALYTNDRHYVMAQRLLNKLETYFDNEDDFWDILTPKTAIDFMKALTQLQRVSVGLPASSPPAKGAPTGGSGIEVLLRNIAKTNETPRVIDPHEQSRETIQAALDDPDTAALAQELIIKMTVPGQN